MIDTMLMVMNMVCASGMIARMQIDPSGTLGYFLLTIGFIFSCCGYACYVPITDE
jgi:hypothetical protein